MLRREDVVYERQRQNGVLRQFDSTTEKPADFRFKGYTNDFMISPRTHAPGDSGGDVFAGFSSKPNTEAFRQQERGGQWAVVNRKTEVLDKFRDRPPMAGEPQPSSVNAESSQSAELRKFREQQKLAEQDFRRLKEDLYHGARVTNEEVRPSSSSRRRSDLQDQSDASVGSSYVSLKYPPKGGVGSPSRFAAEGDLVEHRIAAARTGIETEDRATEARRSTDDRRAPGDDSDDFPYYHPWGKGVGNPRRDAKGQPVRFLHTKGGLQPVLGDDKAIGTGLMLRKPFGGGGGDPQYTLSGKVRTRFPITMKRDKYGHSIMADSPALSSSSPGDLSAEGITLSHPPKSTDAADAYFPFGRPGAGAPLRHQDGSLAPQIRGKMLFNDSADVQRRQRAAKAYLDELKQEMEEHERTKYLQRERKDEEPAQGFAAIIEHGLVGHPRRDPKTGLLSDQHNPASDVTKQKVGQAPAAAGNPRVYHDDLTALAKERHRLRELEKIRERHEDDVHEMHWKELWGRPGGGAPNVAPRNDSPDHKRFNLDKILYHPDGRDVNSQGYVKNTKYGVREMSPMHFQKSYINSSHANAYQMESSGRSSRFNYVKHPYYAVKAPFATDLRAEPY